MLHVISGSPMPAEHVRHTTPRVVCWVSLQQQHPQIWEVPLVTPDMFTLADAIALSPNWMGNTSHCDDGSPTLAQFVTSDHRFVNQRTLYVTSSSALNLAVVGRHITVFKSTDKGLMDTLYMPSTPHLLEMWSRFLFNGACRYLHAGSNYALLLTDDGVTSAPPQPRRRPTTPQTCTTRCGTIPRPRSWIFTWRLRVHGTLQSFWRLGASTACLAWHSKCGCPFGFLARPPTCVCDAIANTPSRSPLCAHSSPCGVCMARLSRCLSTTTCAMPTCT